jgi:small subunit ribosomal protein S17
MADEETTDETTEEPVAEEPVAEEPVAEEPAAAAEPEAEEAPAVEAEAEPEVEAEAEPAAEAAPAAEPKAAPEPEAEPEPVAAPELRKKRKRLPRADRHKHSKPARTPVKDRKPITRTPKPDTDPGRRQERRGIVVSDKGDKTIVVQVETIRIHSKYKKVIRRSSKLHAHDEANSAGIGDTVRVVETRPLSKTKRWRLAEIVEKAK